MGEAAQSTIEKINRTNERIDRLFNARADAANSEFERERRDTMRRHADRCGEHQARYDSAFEPFGKRAPQAAADAFPPDYRRDLFRQGLSMLPSDHDLVGIDPHEDLGSGAIVPMEAKLFEALREQAENPTGDNRADSVNDPKARRVTVDPDTGQRVITYKARRSFIRDFAAPVRHVLRLMDPNKGVVLYGPPFPRMPGR
jgi:hypothetical protein